MKKIVQYARLSKNCSDSQGRLNETTIASNQTERMAERILTEAKTLPYHFENKIKKCKFWALSKFILKLLR